MPSPVAGNVPVQNGVPSQVIASRVGYGPQSATLTVAVSLPSPLTTTESVICAPGVDSCALIWVVIAGAPRTIVVSETSAQAVCTARDRLALRDRFPVRVVAGRRPASPAR